MGLLAGAVLTGHAFESAAIKLGTLEGDGWRIQGLHARLVWLEDDLASLQLNAAAATLPAPLGKVSELQLQCPGALVSGKKIICDQGQLHFSSSSLGRQQTRIRFEYHTDTGRVTLGVEGIRFDGGRLSIAGVFDQEAWDLTLQGAALQLDAVSARLSAAGLMPVQLNGSGVLGFKASLQGRGEQLLTGQVTAGLQTGEFSDEQGNVAGENLALSLDAGLVQAGDQWKINAAVTARQGQVYIDPVFLDLDSQPVHATARLVWQPHPRRLTIRSFDYQQPDTLRVHVDGIINPGQPAMIKALAIDVQEGAFPALYETWLQPWLQDTALADLQTAGNISGQLQWRQGKMTAVHLDLKDLSVDDNERLFGLFGLNGKVNWTRDGSVRQSDVRWDHGHVYRVPLGAAHIATEAAASTLQLREPARIAVLDGELRIDAFEFEYGGDNAHRWRVDGFLTPVSMRQLTRSLGWPEFAGKLSGVIPDVRYTNGNLEVGGMLLVRVFGGDITLRNLRLEQPLSVLPRLWVNAQVNNIDLEELTRTFSFGKIEGRLGGRVDGLYMESWRPVAFDAAFATPVGDTSRHRISQKAVDNISSIGGGVGGALSRSFMRFFKDFPYDRLGISCRLENGTCEMNGVAPATNGYYIVKGRLLPPRLDVIGFSERVNWDRLVSQITAVTRQQDAVVQ